MLLPPRSPAAQLISGGLWYFPSEAYYGRKLFVLQKKQVFILFYEFLDFLRGKVDASSCFLKFFKGESFLGVSFLRSK